MRIKSHWFKSGREHTPEELGAAVSFTVSRIASDALLNTRRAKFEVAIGPQYFAFLTEYLLFLIQVADRIACRTLSAADRFIFTSTLANRVAETYAENHSRLLGGELGVCKQRFIDQLNLRADEYADFEYGEDGPSFHFNRYLGFCMERVMSDKDGFWIVDQMMSIEAPQSVEMVEKTMRDLFETAPRQTRAHRPASSY
ncbi:MAG: hypothetical protein PHP85_09685 [Gallionella sp.]|nr:hypothetical protein [Gallionella sp.]